MAELFRIAKAEKAEPIEEYPFQDELNDLEPFIKKNPQVLGESIEVFGEQVDTGASGKIDLLALDKTAGTAQVALIELKNEVALQPTLWQTVGYASWIRNNPDSIRYLLLEEGISAKNVDFTPKIIIVAPQIDPALLKLSQSTAFEFDFIEIRRFGTKDNCYLIADHKTLSQAPITKVRQTEELDWEKYETKLGISKERIEIGKSLFDKVKAICQENQWDLRHRFNQYYIPFKFGSRNVIFIHYWITSQFCHLGFKLGQPLEELGLSEPYSDLEHRYYPEYGEYYVRIEKVDLDITGYIPFMEAAYRNVTKG